PEDSSNFLNDLSPIPRASPLKGRLSVVPLADGFIPEQPSGILEASMFDILDPLNENLVPAQMARSTTNPYQSSHVSNKKKLSSRSPIKKVRISSPSKLLIEMDKNLVNSNENPKNQEIANTNEKQLKLLTGFTQKWIKVATGQSRDQLDVTKLAHTYMNKSKLQS
uniref:Uncharacterized protein n=1 Tax=Acrobeloides nanus TaxID=290746 RepID=A0A914CW67_9BILA